MNETDLQAKTPAPDATVTPEGGAPADPSPAVADPDESKPKGVGKRIDELTRNWRETQRDRDHWRDLALRSTPRETRTEPSPREEPSAPKTLADFEYDEGRYQAYLFDLVEKRADKAAERRMNAERERQSQEREQRERETHRHALLTRERKFAADHDDYYDVTRGDVAITADMLDAIADSEDSAAILYHLGKNPEVAERIAQLPARSQARELGRIEARLVSERESAKSRAKTVSNTPAPPPKIDGVAAADTVRTTDPTGDALSDDDWVRLERKRIAKKRR